MRNSLPVLKKVLPAAAVVLPLLVIYFLTLAPGLTWANDGVDGGDLISAAATGGVPHPTGYPLYLLLARLFQELPFGSLAFRTNLMSAVATLFAALLVYAVVSRASASNGSPAWLAGMVAAYAFGLAPLVWSQAVITEVYALQAALTALVVYLYTSPAPPLRVWQKQLDFWRGLALGLAMGNHLTTILLVPAALLLGSLQRQPPDESNSRLAGWRLDRGALLRQLAAFGLGLCLYLLIPLRAAAHPPVNWGNAVTPARLWWLVSGQLYQSYYLEWNLAGVGARLQATAALLIKQFGLAGLTLGIIGLAIFGARSRLYALTGWIAAVSLLFSIFYRSNDSYLYLIPMLLSFAVWIGLGVSGVTRPLPTLGSILALLLIVYFAARSATDFREVDASHDLRAETFSQDVLSAAPQQAILFARGDQAVFALWYFHFALGERRDLIVVAEDLLHFDWYQENLRAAYPALAVPGPFPWPQTIIEANPAHPVCSVEYTDHTEMDCKPSQPPSD